MLARLLHTLGAPPRPRTVPAFSTANLPSLQGGLELTLQGREIGRAEGRHGARTRRRAECLQQARQHRQTAFRWKRSDGRHAGGKRVV